MSVVLANNAVTELAVSLGSSETVLSVSSGTGSRFPVITGARWFPITVVSAEGVLEIMRCTGRSGDVLTVVRGQEGTQSRAFNAGDRVELRVTAEVFNDISAQVASMAQELEETIANLGLTGAVVPFSRITPPLGWLKANGAAVSRTAYAALFEAIGTTFGAGDGSTTFNLPDMRGEFARGWDDGRSADPGRIFGSYQWYQNEAHAHEASTSVAGEHSHWVSGSAASAGNHVHGGLWEAGHDVNGGGSPTNNRMDFGDNWPYAGATLNMQAGEHTHSVSGTAASNGSHHHIVEVYLSGGSEARPRNVALLYCIKY